MLMIPFESKNLSEQDMTEIREVSLRLLRGEGIGNVTPSVARLLSRVLEELYEEKSTSNKETLTSSEAADYLNVSRPYLYKLVKEGKLAAHRVGSHMRLYKNDVASYKELQDEESYSAMRELQEQAQALKMGY